MPSLTIRAMNLFFVPLEMIFATTMFAKQYNRRKLWWLWLVLGVGVIIGACFLLSYLKNIILASVDVVHFNYSSFAISCLVTAVIDLIIFALYVAVVYVVFDTKWTSLTYITCASFLIQNIARCLYFLFLIFRDPNEQAIISSFRDPVNIVLYFVVYIAVYLIAYFVFLRKYRGTDDIDLIKKITIPLITIILINLFMGGINAPRENEWASAIYMCLLICRFFLCGIGLVMQFLIVNWYKMKFEQSVLQQIMYQQKEQYKIAKDSIDTVNINAHDLKKQINFILKTIQSSGEVHAVESELSDMMQSISDLDTTYQTGNRAMDVTLTEKARTCLKKNIKLSTIADGSNLDFISDYDIYALFGNALDNAIEAAERIEDEEGRIISFSVRTGNGLILVHTENTFKEAPDFVDGIPQTIKKDKRIHGFGTKSMISIAKKYGGNVTMKAENGMFYLDVILPIKQ